MQDEQSSDVITELAQRSHRGELGFGELVPLLAGLGVEAYHADYRRAETTYYLGGDRTHVVALKSEGEVAAEFSADGVREAVRGAQRGDVVYPEFVRRTLQAGCVGYFVWISGRRVDYHGRRGEVVSEVFPGSQPARRGNVEIIKNVYAGFARRDIEAVLRLYAADVEVTQSPELPWGGRFVGHAGVREFFARLTGLVDSAVTLERFIDAGEHVVALGRTRGVIRASGAAFDVPLAHVYTLRDGVVVQVHNMIDVPPMLAALAHAAGSWTPAGAGQ